MPIAAELDLVKIDIACAARPSGEPTADAELQQPAAAALANLCSNPVLADQIVREDGMTALTQLAASPDREVQVTFLES